MTSSTNMKGAKNGPTESGHKADETFDSLLLSDQPRKQDEQIQDLTKELAREKDHRKEERLLWILISVILLNITFFTSMESILGPVVIGLFQLIVLTVVAKRLGLEESVQIINKLVSFVANSAKNG